MKNEKICCSLEALPSSNVEAIRFYQEKIVPELEKRNININLIVVGQKQRF